MSKTQVQMAAATSARSPGRASRSLTALGLRRPSARRVAPPLEHRILLTATLCLLAFGAVMVYSASSPVGALGPHGGSGAGEFVRYVGFGAIGLGAMYVLERRGLALVDERAARALLLGSFALLLLVLLPGIGVEVLGARRWFAAGPIQFQPSELMKLALVLYVARWCAEHPRRLDRGFKEALLPVLLVVTSASALIVKEPDLGTALVIAFSIFGLLVAAGLPARHLLALVGACLVLLLLVISVSGYQRARLTGFLHPRSSVSVQGTEYQAYQGQIAVGSGGLFGVGLGKSVQKVFYLPEAQTDFILAVIGEELGAAGIFAVVFLYGMIAYAGLRTARRAGTRYAKLLATGLTSLILCQGLLNVFVVLGLAPLTGVPLPFLSYAPTNLCVMLASVGLLLNISRPAARSLTAVRTERYARVAADAQREQRRRGREATRGRRAG